MAVGPSRFDTIRDSVAREAVGRTLTPFKDPAFSKRQAEKIRVLVATRTKELPPRDSVAASCTCGCSAWGEVT